VATNYESDIVQSMIKNLKYNFVRSLAAQIGDKMNEFLQNKILSDFRLQDFLITAVPLHRKRLNWRGYNQSELIAKNIGSFLKIPYRDILQRIRNTPSQAEIKDRQARIDNLRNSFKIISGANIENKSILLIDDISTTGSTLDNCARALKGAGAKEVIGFVFARNR
jgi:ComF family protein